MQNSMKRIWNKKSREISWFTFSKWYIITWRCKLSKESFRNKCIKIYDLDPSHFLSAPDLSWQAYLKKAKIELELLTNTDMLLMVEKGIRGEMQCIMQYIDMQQHITTIWKPITKTLNHDSLCI